MKRQVQVYGFAWYSPDAWQRLKAVAADVNDLDDTYETWSKNAQAALKQLRRQGLRIEPVELDIDGLLAWCQAEGRAADAAARSTYAAHLLKQRHLAQGQNPAKVLAPAGKESQEPRPKGLSAKAQEIARAAETLYRDEQLPVEVIAERRGISKSTLYRYRRHRGVAIGK
jgi:hypothetical protein